MLTINHMGTTGLASSDAPSSGSATAVSPKHALPPAVFHRGPRRRWWWRGGAGGGTVSVRRLLLRFTAAGLLVMVVLAATVGYLARQAGRQQAVDAARQVTLVAARGVVEPALSDAVVRRDPAALTRFDATVRRSVLQGSVVRIRLWDSTGTVIYSDESRLIGQTFTLDKRESEALRTSGLFSQVSDLDRPENHYEQSYQKLLEVDLGVRSTAGEPLLFQAFFRYEAVAAAGQAVWKRFAPAALGGLLVLQFVQVPFAWSLARRLQRQQERGNQLLQQAASASDAERRRIAGDLHDGVVQDITGLTYTLDAARMQGSDPDRDFRLVGDASRTLRRATAELRSLMVDIYPPNLTEVGLLAALAELSATAEQAGLTVELVVNEHSEDPPPDVAAILFRAAQELLRNVAAHSSAERVEIRIVIGANRARLSVDDDGAGFDADELTKQLAGGHFGIRSLGDLVVQHGGQLTVRSTPGRGTEAEVEVPW